MKKNTLLALMLIFSCPCIMGQKINYNTFQVADTLWKKAETIPNNPQKIKLLLQFSDSLKSEPGHAMRFVQKALTLSQTFKEKDLEAECYIQVGRISYLQEMEYLSRDKGIFKRRDFKVSKENLLQGLIIAKAINNKKLQTAALNQLGCVYSEDYKPKASLDTFLLAKTLAKAIGDTAQLININRNMALLYTDVEQYEAGLTVFKENQLICQALHDTTLLATALEDVGIFYLKKRELVRTKFAEDSWNIDIDSVLQKLNYKMAIPYLEQSLALKRLLNDSLPIIKALHSIGKTHLSLGDYDESLKYYLESAAIAKDLKSYDNRRIANQNILTIYLRKKEYDKGIAYFEANPHRIFSLENDELSYVISELYAQKGDYEKAWKVQKKRIDEDMSWRHFDDNFGSHKKYLFDKENATKNLENSEKDWKWLLTLISLLFLAVLAFVLYKNWQKKQTIRQFREQELEKKTLELNLRALQAQMAPHFAYNCLNALKNLILEEKNTEARLFLTDFSKLLREIFDNFKEDYIALAQEIDFLKHYISIEHKRFNQTFTYTVDIDEEVRLNDIQWSIPPMLIQPIIENAIKYGMAAQSDARNNLIVLFVKIREGVLHVTVEDNGIQGQQGIDMTELTGKWTSKNGKISATQITFERLKLLGGRIDYAKKENGGTIASLHIPLKY